MKRLFTNTIKKQLIRKKLSDNFKYLIEKTSTNTNDLNFNSMDPKLRLNIAILRSSYFKS